MTTRRVNMGTNNLKVSTSGTAAGGGAVNTITAGELRISSATASTNATSIYPYGGVTGSMSRLGFVPGKTYTAAVTARLTAPQTGTLGAGARAITIGLNTGGSDNYTWAVSASAPNAAGTTRLSVTFTVPANAVNVWVRFMNGEGAAAQGGSGGSVYFKDPVLVEGYTTDTFDGDSPATYDSVYAWTGTRGLSTSLELVRDYDPKVRELIKYSLRHEVTATAVPVSGAPVVLDLEDVGLTFSEDWSPHVQATLTVPAALDDSLYDLLDPTARCKIAVDVGYTYPDNTRDVRPLAVLYLMNRGVNRPDDTVELTAASAEAIAQGAKLSPWFGTVNRAGLNEWVEWFARYAMWPEVPVFISTYGPGTAAASLVDIAVTPGMDCWTLINEAASRAGAWVYVDGGGRWIITSRPEATASPAHTIAAGDDGTAFDTKTVVSREGFANSVLITYTWKEGTVDKVIHGYAEVNSGPLSTNTVGNVGDFTERAGPVTQAAANTAAASRLSNLASRSRSLLVEAHAAYWLRPSQTVETQLRTGSPESVLVRSVSYHPLVGAMNLTTRQALNVPMKVGE